MVNEAVETPEEPQAAGTEGPAARLLLPAPPLLRVPGLFTSFSSFLVPYRTSKKGGWFKKNVNIEYLCFASHPKGEPVSTSLTNSITDPDPGSGAFLNPGSGAGFFYIADPWSQILDSRSPTHIFESLVTIFGLKGQ